MSEQAAAHPQPTTKTFVSVWAGLVVITFVEVFLAYEQINLTLMLILLIGLSTIKAAMIIAYFMHLRYEKPGLAWMLMPALVVCICLMAIFFPDAARALRLRP
jgi:cytochrome c oxidase subunit 4